VSYFTLPGYPNNGGGYPKNSYLLIGRRRAVTIIAAIAADFSAHRRGRAAQRPGYRSRRLIERYSSGYFLALCECASDEGVVIVVMALLSFADSTPRA
jgi:hypothetical protein